MRDLDRLIQILESANGAVVSEAFAADCRQAAAWMRAARAALLALDRDAVEQLLAAARAEAERAMRRYPQPNYVISKVAEEAGEAVKAAIHCAEGRASREDVAGEIRQAIAMLIRLYVEGDQVHGLPPIAEAGHV